MESLVSTLLASGIIATLSGYITLKLLEERSKNKTESDIVRFKKIEDDVSKLEQDMKQINHSLTELNTSHRLTSKYMEQFREEQKEENELMRKALTENTSAISSLQSLIERIEKKL